MDKQTIGVVVALLGAVSFMQSFNQGGNSKIIYLILGLVLVIGGLIYAKKKI